MRYAADRPRRAITHGFTIIEIITAMVIIGVICAMAVPSFQGMLAGQKVASASNDLFAALNLTRTEAIQRGLSVTLGPVTAGDWSRGWVIYIDADHNQTQNGSEKTIYSHPAAGVGITIASTYAVISFDPNGRVGLGGNWLFSADNSNQRKVIVNLRGRPRMCNPITDPNNC
jgi:type IV fimbrial biogenesis protein FimT